MISKKKFPYPYDGMLAIANDIDGTDIEQFRRLHRFLNTEAETRMGRGVGLDIADSFWMYNLSDYSADGATAYLGEDTMSYWRGHTTEEEQNAQEILRYIKCGWIDSLHTYGDFSHVGNFSRAHATAAMTELQENDVTISVWINHGDRHNTQNFQGRNEWAYWEGDRPSSEAYHTDVTLENGIQYIWNRGPSESSIGHDTSIEPVSLWDGRQVWGFRRYVADSGIKAFYHSKRREVLDFLHENGVLSRSTAGRLGADLWHPERLHEQLSEDNLQQIVDRNQYAIIGQHLGCRERLLPASAIEALRRLRARQDEGEILVARTSRLLEYNRISEFLDYDVATTGEETRIDITSVRDPIFGTFEPSLEQLRGITFHTETPDTTTISVAGEELAADELQRYSDPSEPAIGIPWFEPDKTDYSRQYV